MTTRKPAHVLTGTRIRERRLALSRRQSDVAREAGISAAYLNLIEHNRRAVTPALVARLAAVLQVPPEELASGREEARMAALREAAAWLDAAALSHADGAARPELAQLSEFLARFPGWAATLIATARRAEAAERQLVTLSDRMTQDPYLLTTLHAVLSAVTSVRSTASILAEEGDALDDNWRRRFHANLDQDSLRLSVTAQALVAYLDSFEAEGAIYTPQEEVEAWIEAGCPPPQTAQDLASDAARAMAAAHLRRIEADRRALPDAALAAAAAAAGGTRSDGAGGDPLHIAAALRQPLDLVMRRLAVLRPDGFARAGLLICDGSGALVLRRAAPGFPLPRPGDACPLWPLFGALAQPQTAIRQAVLAPDGSVFDTISYATRSQPLGLDGPVLSRAQMLILPLAEPAPHAVPGANGNWQARPHGAGAAVPIGPSCRICPRGACVARREPSILSADVAGARD